MAEDKPKHHLFHHHKDGEKPIDAVGISDTTYSTDGVNDYTDSTTVVVAEAEPDYGHEEREHKHREHLGELGAVAAGAFALVNLLTLLRFRYPFVNCTCDDHVFSFLLYMVWFLLWWKYQHEKHKSQKDPEHAHKHKLEEEIAAAAAVGAGGYAFHEHHEKKETKREEEESEGKKHHHVF